MAIITEWVWISSRRAAGPVNGMDGVIIMVEFEVRAFEQSIPQKFAAITGVASLPIPNKADFVSLKDVDRNLMIKWVQNAVSTIPEILPFGWVEGDPIAEATRENNMKLGYESRAVSAFEETDGGPLVSIPFDPGK